MNPFYRGVDLVPRVESTGDGLTVEGYLTVFDEVIRVWDPWIGDYYERIDPKAFNKTLKERTPIMLWNHGMDVTGRVPVGVWQSLRTDDRGLYGVGRLFDNSLVQPVRDAIEGRAITGQSITFYPVIDKRTDDFQDGLPLVVRKEVRLVEGGPVTMPAYETTTVGVRSKPFDPSKFSVTSPAERHDADDSPEPPEPTEATTSRDNATPSEVVPLDPYVAEVLRNTLLEEFNHDRHGR